MSEPCNDHCDFEHAKLVQRATWVCPKCGRDISYEYLFWAEAVHPEWIKPDNVEKGQSNV